MTFQELRKSLRSSYGERVRAIKTPGTPEFDRGVTLVTWSGQVLGAYSKPQHAQDDLKTFELSGQL